MAHKKALLVAVNGDCATVEFTEETSYDMLSKGCGGYTQAVELNNNLTLWCNEEGKLNGLEVNIVAQKFWEEAYGATDIIVGDVVFTGGCDQAGNTLGLSQKLIEKILAAAAKKLLAEETLKGIEEFL
jgi:hypothetical protein